MIYALALDNPPLLVSDQETIQIHAHFTGTPSEIHTIALTDIGQPENLDKLRRLFDAPDSFKPRRSSFAVTEETAERMGGIAKRLNELREAWLNPPEWVDWVRTPEEEKASFPARPVAKPGHEAELKKRTLTNLYNQRPAWLDHAHRELDAAGPPPTVAPTTRRRCPTRKSCVGCWPSTCSGLPLWHDSQEEENMKFAAQLAVFMVAFVPPGPKSALAAWWM